MYKPLIVMMLGFVFAGMAITLAPVALGLGAEVLVTSGLTQQFRIS